LWVTCLSPRLHQDFQQNESTLLLYCLLVCACCSGNMVRRSMNRPPQEADCRSYSKAAAAAAPGGAYCHDARCWYHGHVRTCGGQYEKVVTPEHTRWGPPPTLLTRMHTSLPWCIDLCWCRYVVIQSLSVTFGFLLAIYLLTHTIIGIMLSPASTLVLPGNIHKCLWLVSSMVCAPMPWLLACSASCQWWQQWHRQRLDGLPAACQDCAQAV